MPRITALSSLTVLAPAALAALTIVSAPIEQALAQKPASPVTVVNPDTSPVPTNVVNPTTSPVPTAVVNPPTMPALTSSIDDPGRVAYQGVALPTCQNQSECPFSFSQVPQGHRLVIYHVSVNLSINGSPTNVAVFLYNSVIPLNQAVSTFFAPFSAGNSGLSVSNFDQPVLFYFDARAVPETDVIAFNTTRTLRRNSRAPGG